MLVVEYWWESCKLVQIDVFTSGKLSEKQIKKPAMKPGARCLIHLSPSEIWSFPKLQFPIELKTTTIGTNWNASDHAGNRLEVSTVPVVYK